MQEKKKKKSLRPSQADYLFNAVMEQIKPQYVEAKDLFSALVNGGVNIDPMPILDKHGKKIVNFTKFKVIHLTKGERYRIPLKIQNGARLLTVEKAPYPNLTALLDIAYGLQAPPALKRPRIEADLSEETETNQHRVSELASHILLGIIIKILSKYYTQDEFISELKDGINLCSLQSHEFSAEDLKDNLKYTGHFSRVQEYFDPAIKVLVSRNIVNENCTRLTPNENSDILFYKVRGITIKGYYLKLTKGKNLDNPGPVEERLLSFIRETYQKLSEKQSELPYHEKRSGSNEIRLFKVETRIIIELIIKIFRERYPTREGFMSALKEGNGIKLPEEISFAKNELSDHLSAISLSATDLTASQGPKHLKKTIQKLKDNGFIKEDAFHFQAVRFNFLRGIVISKIEGNLYLRLCSDPKKLTYEKSRKKIETFIKQVYIANKESVRQETIVTKKPRHNPRGRTHSSKFHGLLIGVIIYQILRINPTLNLAETLRQGGQTQFKANIYFSEDSLRKIYAAIYDKDAGDDFNYVMEEIKTISEEEDSQWCMDPPKVRLHQSKFRSKDNEIALLITRDSFWLRANRTLAESFKTIEELIQELRVIAPADTLEDLPMSPVYHTPTMVGENFSRFWARTEVDTTPPVQGQGLGDWMDTTVDDPDDLFDYSFAILGAQDSDSHALFSSPKKRGFNNI